MGVMRFQFSMKTILLVFVVFAISCAAILFWSIRVVPGGISFWRTIEWLLINSFVWVPAIFTAYAIGRRALTARMVICFAIAEAIAFMCFYHLYFVT